MITGVCCSCQTGGIHCYTSGNQVLIGKHRLLNQEEGMPWCEGEGTAPQWHDSRKGEDFPSFEDDEGQDLLDWYEDAARNWKNPEERMNRELVQIATSNDLSDLDIAVLINELKKEA